MIIKKLFSKFLGVAFCCLDYFWKKHDITIFGSGRGARYFDNSKALFEYSLSQGAESYWFYTGGKPQVEGVSPERFIKTNSLYGMLIALRAKKVFASYGSLDFGLYRFSRKTITVQLWHGIPVKKIFYAEKNITLRKRIQYYFEIAAFEYFVVSSRLEQYLISSQTGIPLEKVKILGYPRNDFLFKSRKEFEIPEIISMQREFEKIILFAPTFRNNEYSVFSSFDDADWNGFFEYLRENSILCVFRAHAVEFLQSNDRNAQRLADYSDNVIFLGQDKYQDAQELMVYSDILISDYSGMVADYLLLDKPIIRFIFDEELYDFERGVNFLQEQLTIGLTAVDMPSLIEAIDKCINDELSATVLHNNSLAKSLYHDNHIGGYSKQVYDYFNSLVKDDK